MQCNATKQQVDVGLCSSAVVNTIIRTYITTTPHWFIRMKKKNRLQSNNITSYQSKADWFMFVWKSIWSDLWDFSLGDKTHFANRLLFCRMRSIEKWRLKKESTEKRMNELRTSGLVKLLRWIRFGCKFLANGQIFGCKR